MNEGGRFATEIKRLREQRGLTKGQLAAYAQMSRSTISLWEAGKRKTPDPRLLKQVAPHLGTTFEHLLLVAGYREAGYGDFSPERPALRAVDGKLVSEDEIEMAEKVIRALRMVLARRQI